MLSRLRHQESATFTDNMMQTRLTAYWPFAAGGDAS
jgi:hypothetical protein